MLFRFTLFTESQTIPAPDQPIFPGLGLFVNVDPGTTAWTTGSTPSVAPAFTSKLLRGAISGGVDDVEYTINFDLTVAGLIGGPHNILVRIRLYNSSFTTYEDQATAVFFTNGNKVGFVTMTPSFDPAYIVFLALESSGAGASVTINSYSGSIASDPVVITGDSLVITEPDGWKDSTLKLERHPDFHSLIEHFEGDFTFYGSNEFVNGGIDFIKEKIDAFGVDTTIFINIELALNDVDYTTVFEGQLAIPEVHYLINNKLRCNIIRDDFWTKFIKRLDTPIDLRSSESLDGDALTVYDHVNINLTSQLLPLRYLGIEQFGTLIIMDEEYIQFQPDTDEIDELPEVFFLPRATNSEKPVWIYEAEYAGETVFDFRIEYSKTESVTGHTGARTIYDFWFQLNDEAPVEFSYASGAYVDATVYDNWPNPPFIPPGDNSIETTIATYQTTLTLSKGDVIRVYLQRDTASDNNITFWGDQGLFADKAGAYPFKCNRPLGMQERPTYYSIIQQSVFPSSNAEGFLIHDAAAAIVERLIGQNGVFYSSIFGSMQTMTYEYSNDGCEWFYVLLKGLHIRQYSLFEKAFFMSFKQWWEGANPIFSLGLGYELLDLQPEDEPTVDSFGSGFNQGSGATWAPTGFPGFQVSLTIFQSSKLLSFEIFGGIADATYTIGYDITTSAAGTIRIRLYDETFTDFVSNSVTVLSSGNHTGNTVLVPTFEPKYVAFLGVGPIGGIDIEVDAFSFDVTNLPDEAPRDVIRIEKKEHFFDNSFTSVYIPNIRDIEVSFDPDYHFNLIRIGYNKWESEATSGLDDPQTKRQYSTRFKKAGDTIDLYSSFIAAGLTIETTRRQSKEKSADYKYDNDTFIIAIRPDPIEISPETSPDVIDYEPELDENFDSVDNLNNPDTRYNLRLTPARNLIRWIKYLSGCLQKYLTSSFKFASGEGNYDMVSEMTAFSPDCDEYFDILYEDGNIPVSTEPLFVPQLIEMTVTLTWEEYLIIRQYRKNPIGISQTDTNFTNLFIKELSFKPVTGQATIKGWPSEEFILVVPEDEFNGGICSVAPTVEECAIEAEDEDILQAENNEFMILEEC